MGRVRLYSDSERFVKKNLRADETSDIFNGENPQEIRCNARKSLIQFLRENDYVQRSFGFHLSGFHQSGASGFSFRGGVAGRTRRFTRPVGVYGDSHDDRFIRNDRFQFVFRSADASLSDFSRRAGFRCPDGFGAVRLLFFNPVLATLPVCRSVWFRRGCDRFGFEQLRRLALFVPADELASLLLGNRDVTFALHDELRAEFRRKLASGLSHRRVHTVRNRNRFPLFASALEKMRFKKADGRRNAVFVL